MNTTTGRTQTNRERQWRILAQIAVLVLIAAACGSSEGDASTTFSSDDALSVTDAYFEEFNTGDVDAVLSLFSPDATIDSGFGGRYTRTEFEMITAYYTAQGTTLTPPECTVTDEVPTTLMKLFNENLSVVAARAVAGIVSVLGQRGPLACPQGAWGMVNAVVTSLSVALTSQSRSRPMTRQPLLHPPADRWRWTATPRNRGSSPVRRWSGTR